MNTNCHKCGARFLPGEEIHRKELRRAEVPLDLDEPHSLSLIEGPWIHDECEPFPKVQP